MRRLLLSLALLAALLGGTLLHARYVESAVTRVTHTLRAAELLAHRGAWDQARLLTRQAREDWEEERGYVYLFLGHGEADQILLSFRGVEQTLAPHTPDPQLFTAALLQLTTRLELLAGMEQPDWLNVL